uniref:Endonuclease/exonuclease/phosphatase domain-containing protein n=1 Tax=Dendroctonus ponderosae TaxID=77166 RepID=A0AAR5PC88_DENPD
MIKYIQSYNGISAFATLELSKDYRIKIIQIYAPTSTHEDEEVEIIYEDIGKALDKGKCNNDFVIGDFNATVGKKLFDDGPYISNQGLGEIINMSSWVSHGDIYYATNDFTQ